MQRRDRSGARAIGSRVVPLSCRREGNGDTALPADAPHACTHAARTSLTTRAEIGADSAGGSRGAAPLRVAINSVASRAGHACYSRRRLTCSSAIFRQSRIIYSEARITCQPPSAAAAGACLYSHRRFTLHASCPLLCEARERPPPSFYRAYYSRRMRTHPTNRRQFWRLRLSNRRKVIA